MTTTPVHSITDEQLAELAEGCMDSIQCPISALYELAERLREAEKDAARYRWLRDKQTFIWTVQDWLPDDKPFTNVDESIDTAMQEHTK